MDLSYSGQPIKPSIEALGADRFTITIHLSRADQEALGMESGILTDWFVRALQTLVALRTGQVDRETERGGVERGEATKDTWYWGVNDLETHLLPALEGIRDAAMREYRAAGASHNDMGLALNVARSTAQDRLRNLGTEESERELWARSHAGDYARTRGGTLPGSPLEG